MGEFGSSVLATDNAIMAACLAEGETILEGCAKEPETIDLIHFLKKMGAQIEGEGNSKIKITGVDNLSGCEYNVIEDRIEAGTYLIFAAITGSEIKINYQYSHHLKYVLDLCKDIGINISNTQSHLIVKGKSPNDYNPFDIVSLPYPHFPTDLQPLFMALATIVPHTTTIKEKIYSTRFRHIDELMRMGANIHLEKKILLSLKESKNSRVPL